MHPLDPWHPPYPPLLARLWPAPDLAPAVRATVLVGLGVALLVASAEAHVPFWPVPLTLQGLVVLLLAAGYGLPLGPLTVAVYLALGALGLPVFAATPERGLGLAYMAGPTGGYLIGFLLAALVVAGLARQGWDRSWRGTLAAMAWGLGLIYLCGFLWLARLIGPGEAWAMGVQPFLPTAFLKLLLATMVLPLAWRSLRRRSRLF